MELANITLTACFAVLRIIIIRVCVKIIVMARFIWAVLVEYQIYVLFVQLPNAAF